MMQRFWLQIRQSWLAMTVLAVLVVGALWPSSKLMPINVFDQPFYLGIAHDLYYTGTFTDGFAFADVADGETRPPGMRFAPVYPTLLAAVAKVDTNFRAAMDCVVATHANDRSCPNHANVARALHIAMLVAFFVMIWRMAGEVLGSPRAAFVALLLALLTTPVLLRYVNYMMTEITSIFLFAAALTAGLTAMRSERPARWLAIAGLFLGLVALTRPAYAYLCYAAAVVALAVAALSPSRRKWLPLAAIFIVVMFAPLALWLTRNAAVVGHVALTHGYDSHTLAQRVSFDQMTWREYGLSYICWLPDGIGIGEWLFGPHTCDKFGWEEPATTFFNIGRGVLLEQTLAAAGGWEHHLAYLLKNYVFADPLKHFMVTISLALRGAWIHHYWGFVLMPVCLYMTLRALRQGDYRFLIVALPAWFMLLFNAAVAVNHTRYNLVLIPAFAISGAALVERVLNARERHLVTEAASQPVTAA